MKKLSIPAVLTLSCLFAASCSEKFNVAAPYKNITVIYSYLDMADTAHYVRIQKAFLDQNKSALVMATSPDSSFYSSLNVMIKRLRFYDTSLADTIHLYRVDLDKEGYPKQSGAFFTAPNYAYKFTNLLDPNYLYRIVVTNPATGQKDSATCPIIDDGNDNNFISSSFSDTAAIDFTATSANQAVNIFCQYQAPDNFNFENFSVPASVSQVVIRFNWVDSDYTTHATSRHHADFDAGYQTLTPLGNNVSIQYQIPNIQIYNAINSGLGTAPDHIIRLMDKCNLYVYLGTLDFMSYQQNALIQGVGLTGSEIQPQYTNIQGPDALGLFTSRGMKQGLLKISNNTMDSLENGSLNKRNNIRGRVN